MTQDNFQSGNPYLDINVGAILRYNGAANQDPAGSLADGPTNIVTVLTDQNLVPVVPSNAPSTVGRSVNFDFQVSFILTARSTS
jgi:hypothetical protein